MKLAALATATWGLDLCSAFLLPPGAERNPAAVVLLSVPLLALAAKSAALSLAVNAARYHRGVLGVVAGAGLIGFASNVWALS